MSLSQIVTPITLAFLAGALLSGAGHAKDWSEIAHFEPPLKTEKVTERAAGEPDREITCTRYADLVVRQRDTDSSDPDDAILIPVKAGSSIDCKRAPGPEAHKIEVSGMIFMGRNGTFLFFEEADTNGIFPFVVFDAGTGRKLFEDASGYDGIDTFANENGTLKLGFRRAVRVDCSIPKQGAACWTRILREEPVPQPVAALAAPIKACADAYRSDKAPKDSESIVSFDVRLVWTGGGPLEVQASGPLRCQATR